MVATSDYATVRLQTEDAEWRPRGAYWLQAAVISLAGNDTSIWIYRIPSLLAAVGTAVLTWWTALAFGRPQAALFAGLFVAAAGVVGLVGRLATPDALLVFGLMLAMGALARVWGQRPRTAGDVIAALFWTGLGIGILAKGI